MVKPWADGPFKLLETPGHRNARTGKTSITKNEEGAHKLANVMALVHNVLIRGLNAIYLQASNISLEQDIKDFCTFMYAWSLTLHAHHDNEESLGFPFLEEMTGIQGLLDINVQQHRLFDEGLKSFDLYVASVKDGLAKYDGAHVRRLIDTLAPPLFEHLAAEESLEKRPPEMSGSCESQPICLSCSGQVSVKVDGPSNPPPQVIFCRTLNYITLYTLLLARIC
ncbi:hypothetical protein BP5796_09311 [Coleophoma crateriformis]|uniref:Hemerythrin-like domain-containing protein n=1 Tax=Coleophoma crateriformis TaxID=565419 RepID=A0A3D8R4B0_9HELO|nr:hypothetical protein BP5796_09311 [Coleophoma crateriformis]